MTAARALALGPSVTATIQELTGEHREVDLVMGNEYVRGIDLDILRSTSVLLRHISGSIGMKLNHLHNLLRTFQSERRSGPVELALTGRPLYFLPDWDDFLDADFDFQKDEFSSEQRSGRREHHTSTLMRPRKICDGILVSLAQHLGGKGLLRHVSTANHDSLAPKSVRQHFNLSQAQWAFGDCGAFSYAGENAPTISVEQAVYVYDLYEFDFGASVDHIPLAKVYRDGKRIPLAESERRRRTRLTRDNADRFLRLHREYDARFVPVGIIQGLDSADYAAQVGDYVDMGYRHLAIGGLVPRSDEEIAAIVEAVTKRFKAVGAHPWVHLMGVFRPRLQGKFRQLGVNSFDSATYFRKAWLRSEQNYLGADEKWYAAIRVPPSSDGRTLARLKESGVSELKIRSLEQKALWSLHAFDQGKISAKTCLRAVRKYDRLLSRKETTKRNIFESYHQTLMAKPWRKCPCNVCRSIGIDVIIFRGYNRNKRRGAHNTLQLFEAVRSVK